MKLMEKHPLVMIIIGIAGISLSAIFVKYSQAPAVVTALYRLLWTVALMTPVVLGRKDCRRELMDTDRRTVLLCGASGVFLALHFTAWFESLNQTSVASSTAIVCTEVIWVALGYCLFMKGKISGAAALSLFRLLRRRKPPVRGCTGPCRRRILRRVHPDWAAGQGIYVHDDLHLHCLCVLRPGPGAGNGFKRACLYWLRGAFRGCGTSSQCVFHPFWAQHFQLVPEILFPLLCIRLQAVRACGSSCVCPVPVRGSACPPPDSRGCGDNRRRFPLFSGGKERK